MLLSLISVLQHAVLSHMRSKLEFFRIVNSFHVWLLSTISNFVISCLFVKNENITRITSFAGRKFFFTNTLRMLQIVSSLFVNAYIIDLAELS